MRELALECSEDTGQSGDVWALWCAWGRVGWAVGRKVHQRFCLSRNSNPGPRKGNVGGDVVRAGPRPHPPTLNPSLPLLGNFNRVWGS